jgi:lipid-A-disaccharide synthase
VLKPAKKGEVDLLVLAAECSGDELGAELIGDCIRMDGAVNVWSAGGNAMAKAGGNFLINVADHSAMGLFDVIRHLPFFLRYCDAVVDWIANALPKRVCFIDSPSLHLRVAKKLAKMGIAKKAGGPVSLYYYVAPQVWAWKPERKFEMAKIIDSLAVLFPFEVAHFANTAMATAYVGHPFMDEGCRSPIHYANDGAMLLLPGSRPAVVRRNFPPMLEAATAPELEEIQPVVSIYPTKAIGEILAEEVAKVGRDVRLISTDEALKNPVAARLVAVSAGTMSLRCALEAIPGVIVYRTHPMTYWIGRHHVKLSNLGIASIILGYEFYPEFIQGAAEPRAMAEKLAQFIGAGDDFAAVACELRRELSRPHLKPAQWLMEKL